ncbi:MAG: hypothetical protein JWN69_2040, partial [Alphaproteobacteria bacterium]|nr:hypothetical protein [Alphaproteobacteria bacterium]
FVAQTRATPAVDEEHFRLLSGFNDIFVSIAAIILLVAVTWIGRALQPGGTWSPIPGLFIAATAWGLAEFFTRKRRMALPSIILLLAFVGGIFFASLSTLSELGGQESLDGRAGALVYGGAAALTAAAAWFHWRRFRVPITVAAGASAIVGLLLALIGSIIGDSPATRDVMLGFGLALGVAMFLFAMRWDSTDPLRQTGRSDVAFWLHLLAAPLIVHPAFVLLGLTSGDASTLEALVVLLLYVALGIAALAVDRRALLVSALAYVLYALNSLFENNGVVELSVAFTALVIGSALLLLSAFWHSARHAIVAALPAAIQAKLPALDRPVPVQRVADPASS